MDPSSAPAPIQVWIAEDHSLFGQRLMRALNRHPDINCPFHFSSGEDTLAALESHPAPTVLLLDLDLPGMGGGKALPSSAKKHLTLPSSSSRYSRTMKKIFQCICSGASGYLLKPLAPMALRMPCGTAASGGSPITPSVARRVLDLVSRTKAAPKEHGMTPREMEMLRALSKGLTLKEAAAEMGISYHTADDYVRGIYRKLEVRNRSGAVAKAIQEGWVSPQ